MRSNVKVIVDRPLGSHHPDYLDMIYSVNYGYIEGTVAPDGEEEDAYILGVDVPLDVFYGEIIAIIHRRNDVEHKWVVAPKGCTFSLEEIYQKVFFQERYFDISIDLL